MSRTTLIKYRGKTIAVLGKTVDMAIFSAREKNVDLIHEDLNEDRDDLIKYLLSNISAMVAHHPTKEEVSEWLSEADDIIGYAIEKAEEIGASRVIANMMEEDEIDIEFT